MSISDRAAPRRSDPTIRSPEVHATHESALDVLDLDPRLSLSELVEALGERAHEGPARAELARRTFEALTERPEAHFDELMRTVPRVPTSTAMERRSPLAPVGPSDLARSLAQRMGPPTAEERAALEEDA